MPRRAVVIPMSVPRWTPPGLDPVAWRSALAEDLVDLIATLAEVEPAVAVVAGDRAAADAIVWPGMRVYEVGALTVRVIFKATCDDGYEQAALIAPDAPDLPAMLIGKLLRPLSSRPVAAAPREPAGEPGLLGVAARLPAPEWLPDLDLDAGLDALLGAAPRPGLVATTAGWHRLTGPAALTRLDPGLEGWSATRAMLTG